MLILEFLLLLQMPQVNGLPSKFLISSFWRNFTTWVCLADLMRSMKGASFSHTSQTSKTWGTCLKWVRRGQIYRKTNGMLDGEYVLFCIYFKTLLLVLYFKWVFSWILHAFLEWHQKWPDCKMILSVLELLVTFLAPEIFQLKQDAWSGSSHFVFNMFCNVSDFILFLSTLLLVKT